MRGKVGVSGGMKGGEGNIVVRKYYVRDESIFKKKYLYKVTKTKIRLTVKNVYQLH